MTSLLFIRVISISFVYLHYVTNFTKHILPRKLLTINKLYDKLSIVYREALPDIGGKSMKLFVSLGGKGKTLRHVKDSVVDWLASFPFESEKPSSVTISSAYLITSECMGCATARNVAIIEIPAGVPSAQLSEHLVKHLRVKVST